MEELLIKKAIAIINENDGYIEKEITIEAAEKYQTYILMNLGRDYHRLGIAMQLHYSCYRNANERIYNTMGPDTGVDMIAQTTCGISIAQFLSELDKEGKCPKTIIYSLNPADNELIGSMIGCFQSDEIPGKRVQDRAAL